MLGLALAQAGPTASEISLPTRTVADGLAGQQRDRKCVSDRRFLWIATPDGLVRYDGVKTSVYRSHTHPALPSNRLIDLTLDGDGVLWLFAETGRLGRVEDGQVQPLKVSIPVPSWPTGSIFRTGFGWPHDKAFFWPGRVV